MMNDDVHFTAAYVYYAVVYNPEVAYTDFLSLALASEAESVCNLEINFRRRGML